MTRVVLTPFLALRFKDQPQSEGECIIIDRSIHGHVKDVIVQKLDQILVTNTSALCYIACMPPRSTAFVRTKLLSTSRIAFDGNHF